MKKYAPYQHSEQLIADLLQRQGWSIQRRNYRGKGFEIDIIALKEDTLLFVEVKLRRLQIRTNYQFCGLMTKQKQRALYRGSQKYLYRNRINTKKIRFDLAVINYRGRIQYFTNII